MNWNKQVNTELLDVSGISIFHRPHDTTNLSKILKSIRLDNDIFDDKTAHYFPVDENC